MRWFKKINEIVYYCFKIKSETLEAEYTLTELMRGGWDSWGIGGPLGQGYGKTSKHFRDTWPFLLSPKVRV